MSQIPCIGLMDGYAHNPYNAEEERPRRSSCGEDHGELAAIRTEVWGLAGIQIVRSCTARLCRTLEVCTQSWTMSTEAVAKRSSSAGASSSLALHAADSGTPDVANGGVLPPHGRHKPVKQ